MSVDSLIEHRYDTFVRGTDRELIRELDEEFGVQLARRTPKTGRDNVSSLRVFLKETPDKVKHSNILKKHGYMVWVSKRNGGNYRHINELRRQRSASD